MRGTDEASGSLFSYGRNKFSRDPDTGLRISRPAEEHRIVYQEEPALQIIDNDVWNRVQDRLMATHAKHAVQNEDDGRLNRAHRAKFLLSRLVSCGCCGGGYTIVAQDRYGCYRRKSQGKKSCSNSKTISRQKLEARVLRRIRKGLLTPEMTALFETEVSRLLAERAQKETARTDILVPTLAKLEKTIERQGSKAGGVEVLCQQN